jgi:hypothetical protein
MRMPPVLSSIGSLRKSGNATRGMLDGVTSILARCKGVQYLKGLEAVIREMKPLLRKNCTEKSVQGRESWLYNQFGLPLSKGTAAAKTRSSCKKWPRLRC